MMPAQFSVSKYYTETGVLPKKIISHKDEGNLFVLEEDERRMALQSFKGGVVY
jgi:hypothetical protein